MGIGKIIIKKDWRIQNIDFITHHVPSYMCKAEQENLDYTLFYLK